MSQQQHGNSEMSTVRLCPSCSAPLSRGERFCGQCGYSLLTQSDTHPTAVETVQSRYRSVGVRKRLTLLSRLSLLVIIVLAVGFWLEVFGVAPRLGQSSPGTTASSTQSPGSTVSARPSPGSTGAPTQSATSTILYSEDGGDNWSGWKAVDPVHNSWSAKGGVLSSDGTDNRAQIAPTIVPPFQVSGTDDYTIEAKISVVSWSPYDRATQKQTSGFALTFRGTPGVTWTGYMLECFNTDAYGFLPTCYIANNLLSLPPSALASSRYDPGNVSHTYDIRVQGNQIDVSIDGSHRLGIQDNEFLHGGQVGLWTTNTALAVTSFTVSTL